MDPIRAWKDVDYRYSLSAEELAAVPTHPGGLVSVGLDELSGVAGAAATGNWICWTVTVSLEICPFTQQSNCGTCAAGSLGCC